MTRSKTILILLAGFWVLGPSRVLATPEADFIADISKDYQSISGTLNGPFSKSMGFFSTLGWNNPPAVFDLMAFPKVEVGVGLGADIINLPGLNGLNLAAIVPGSNIVLPAFVPAPFPVATGRIGLLNGLDFGVRIPYLPKITVPGVNFSANFTGWGIDLRYKIFDAMQLPAVTVGVSYDTMKGNLTIGTDINQGGNYFDTNTSTSYALNYTGTTSYALDWDVHSFGAQLQVGKDLGVLYPFAAIGFQRNSGTVTSTLSANGSFTLNGGANTPVNINAVSSALPTTFEPKYVLGFDMGMALHWSVVAESNGTDVAGSTSFRFQF